MRSAPRRHERWRRISRPLAAGTKASCEPTGKGSLA
jgi:hypothetical protein